MSSIEIDAPGVADLAASLEDAATAAAELTRTNTAAGDLVIAGADVPHLTGYLESSLTVTASDDGVTITAGAPYAGFVHSYRPFLTDSLDAHADAVVELYTDHLATVLDIIEGS